MVRSGVRGRAAAAPTTTDLECSLRIELAVVCEAVVAQRAPELLVQHVDRGHLDLGAAGHAVLARQEARDGSLLAEHPADTVEIVQHRELAEREGGLDAV